MSSAQKKPNRRLAERIADKFDPKLVGVLTVAVDEDGDLHVLDGQTRLAAMHLVMKRKEEADP